MSLPTHTILTGTLFDATGYITTQTVEVEIGSEHTRVGGAIHNNCDLVFAVGEITGPGGWYIVLDSALCSVSWSDSRDNGDVIATLPRGEAIAFADRAFAEWGASNHPDYRGVYWTVADDEGVIHQTPACK